MFNLLKKKNKSKIEIIGKEFPFTLLKEDDEGNKDFIFGKKWRFYHDGKNGKKYWENIEPYKIIDGNLCVRICTDEYYKLSIVFTKDDLVNILEEMNSDKSN